MDNPFRRVRKEKRLTLDQMASEVGIHHMALFYGEQGCYSHPLPAVLQWMRDQGFDLDIVRAEYYAYQRDKRRLHGELYSVKHIDDLGPPEAAHPFVAFRHMLDPQMTRSKFCKRFCVHPSTVEKLEKGSTHSLPDQITDAMRDAGLTENCLRELNFRIEEWCGASHK